MGFLGGTTNSTSLEVLISLICWFLQQEYTWHFLLQRLAMELRWSWGRIVVRLHTAFFTAVYFPHTNQFWLSHVKQVPVHLNKFNIKLPKGVVFVCGKKCNCSVLIWWPHIFLAIVYFDKLDECRANHLILLPASVRRSTAILLSESGWSILVERRKPWWRLYNDTKERARQAAWHVLSLDLCIRFKYWIVWISA